MNHLQISLALAGIALLAILFGYNVWNNRRHTPKRPDPERSPRLEPLADPALPAHSGGIDLTGPADAPTPATPKHPVTIDAVTLPPTSPSPAPSGVRPGAPSPQPVTGDLFAELPEPDEHSSPTPPFADNPRTPAAQQQSANRRGLNPLIDAICALRLDSPVTSESVQLVQPPTRRAGNKSFLIEGLNASTQGWEGIRSGQSYLQLQAGVQLANRMGPLNEIEFEEFAHKITKFAEHIGATPALPDAAQEVARARELDQFASQHDAQLSLSVRAREVPWSAAYVQQQAAALGFVEQTPALGSPRMQLPSRVPGDAPLLVLTLDDPAATQPLHSSERAVTHLTLSLDVPQVPRSEQPFARLCQYAQLLCTNMDAVLCDTNGQPLNAAALQAIDQDLQALYDRLDAQGLSAGSTLARRLFS